MTDTELKSCIGTIEMLRRLHGVMNVIDAGNCEKIIKVLSDIPKYKDAYNKGWDDGAKATYEHLKMCEEETSGDLISRDAVIDSLYDWSDHSMTDAETWHLRQVIGDIKSLPSFNPQDSKILNTLDFAIDASNGGTNYFVGLRNGLRYAKSLIDGEEPQFESCAEQEPKTGHWIDKFGGVYRCSCCRETIEIDTEIDYPNGITFNYCPNCGTRMESEE